MCFWGFCWYHTPRKGSYHPQNLQLPTVNGAVQPNLRNIKTSCYRNYCINSSQILHNDKHHRLRFVGGLNTRPTNPVWQTAAILKKRVYRDIFTTVEPILTKFCMAAHIVSAGRPLKFRIFENPRQWRPPYWKFEKNTSQQRLDQFLRNLVRWLLWVLCS